MSFLVWGRPCTIQQEEQWHEGRSLLRLIAASFIIQLEVRTISAYLLGQILKTRVAQCVWKTGGHVLTGLRREEERALARLKTGDEKYQTCGQTYNKWPFPWTLLRITAILSAGMGQKGIWREHGGWGWEKTTDEEEGSEKGGAVEISSVSGVKGGQKRNRKGSEQREKKKSGWEEGESVAPCGRLSQHALAAHCTPPPNIPQQERFHPITRRLSGLRARATQVFMHRMGLFPQGRAIKVMRWVTWHSAPI